MPGFETGTVVRVPFPYTDHDTRQRRPALVVSRGGVGLERALLWVVMITSAANRGWRGDVPLDAGHRAAGLPVASLIRTAKIATIDAGLAEPIGTIAAALLAEVRTEIAAVLSLAVHEG